MIELEGDTTKLRPMERGDHLGTPSSLSSIKNRVESRNFQQQNSQSQRQIWPSPLSERREDEIRGKENRLSSLNECRGRRNRKHIW
jgi:hypothetical protein